MTCDACARLSKSRIGKIPGVKEVRISDASGDAEVLAEREIDLSEIQTALSGTDYTVANI